ncbi:MAG TPA: M17 family peptidase N-terminal domain-containing protein [Polyangiales bacterium]|nr:M17 family peptidase N-terminal domain-containing protein [Polyangiales bacterium]
MDALRTELLVVPVFSDERPLRGAAGLADWRLCGRLSDLLVRGQLRGEFDDALLMPPPERRLVLERILCLGAGARTDVNPDRLRLYLRTLVKRALGLRVRTMAVALPHASLTWLSPEQAIDVLLEEAQPHSERFDEITVLDTPDAQRRMEPRIERMRRRALQDV